MVKRKLAYVCDVCGLTERDFASKKNFFEHVKSSIHTNLQFKCDECDLEFQYMKGVQLHKSAKHEARIFNCESCGLGFSLKGNLKRHIEVHHNQNSCFSCIKCRKEFSNYVEFNFRKHLDSCRGRSFDSTKVKCTICSKDFKNMKTLSKESTISIRTICQTDLINFYVSIRLLRMREMVSAADP